MFLKSKINSAYKKINYWTINGKKNQFLKKDVRINCLVDLEKLIDEENSYLGYI